jgi:hypothetical protein
MRPTTDPYSLPDHTCPWSHGGMTLTGKTEELRQKPVTVPLRPRKIPNRLASLTLEFRRKIRRRRRRLKVTKHNLSSCFENCVTDGSNYKLGYVS